MADYLRGHGIPAGRIVEETESHSTRENAERVAPLLYGPPQQVVLLTSDFHMWRARRVFARIGIQAVSYPAPDAEKWAGTFVGRWAAFIQLSFETAKIVYYALRGWL
jgi:uncharacterized SAM-binding protein YcdF (DUF218 family)